jgi:ubiquinone/menaquinone biosynthesis C-methylase UbiE
MGIYARLVLPRLTDLAMGSRPLAEERAALIPAVCGRVLEIGVGSGLNLPLYGAGVRRLSALDPSLALWKLARSRAARAVVPVEFAAGSAEHLPFETGAFDAVVTTWTLCSIPDPHAALAEVGRVLVPGGQLFFVEHGRAPDARVRAWQDRLTPLWSRLAGGCHLNRPIEELIARAGFRIARIERGYKPGPRPFTYRIRGVARLPA